MVELLYEVLIKITLEALIECAKKNPNVVRTAIQAARSVMLLLF